ncbi:hypothetical protein [Mesorhizobium sp. CO1-1-8]|uniref:hypothetical protein n=1 Tax=Mesorhizobium sp. CO1-1-8 TaxID=2876631 RepID=UPI001CD0A9FA|nr:hypothetical protein [Mesorhizobium sp. CO1-1-8]MBZ9776110.1 hypothetical protein [Mesorhizobium sp. CO1-1-8]
MFIQPIEYFLAVWFALAAASTLYVGFGQYRNNPEPVVHHTTNNNVEEKGGGLMVVIDVG